jgi:hypothetical protein
MEEQTTRQSVAEWYAQQIFENCTTPISEVEWLIENLKESKAPSSVLSIVRRTEN